MTIALQAIRVDTPCVISAPGRKMSEKEGGGRQQSGESEFGRRRCSGIAVAMNEEFPPQRFGHMTVYV